LVDIQAARNMFRLPFRCAYIKQHRRLRALSCSAKVAAVMRSVLHQV
jgi:hypothetical protein